jgi:hypothetical protein
MAKSIDPIKKARYKAARLRGVDKKNSMLQAGYALTTAIQSPNMTVVKISEKELAAQIKASDINTDWVIGKLNQELQSINAKTSDRVRILELFGKYLNMFRDNQPVQVNVFSNDILNDLPPIDITPVIPSTNVDTSKLT